MAYPSHIARNALRSALRNHPQSDKILSGRLVNTLALAELKAALAALGCDPDHIAQNALAGHVTSLVPMAANYGDDTMAANAAGMNAYDDGLSVHDNPYGSGHATKHLRDAWNEGWMNGDHCARQDQGDQSNGVELEPVNPDQDQGDQDQTSAIETEVQTIRSLIVTGGFSALDSRLRELVTEARKPAVEVIREVMVPAEAPLLPGAVAPAKPTGQTAKWRKLFAVEGALGDRETQIWDGSHPYTPKINDRYLWPHPQTATALSQIARGRNVMLYGPAGTGKTEWAQQLAAKTGRPFMLISCDNGTDAATLVGMTVPDGDRVKWQDGQLTRAIRTPGCVVCLDEPSVARPGALFVMQNVLANRELFIAETGEKVKVASGVLFVATDNTNGTGGGARKGYTDTNRINAAFLDRFGVRVKVDYLPNDREAAVIAGYTGCTMELANLLVGAATVTRVAADNETLSHGIGLRRLLSWAELLTDGIDAESAFQSAILNCASEQDVETLREQCLLTYDAATVALALNPRSRKAAAVDPAVANPTIAGRDAARDFAGGR